MGLNPDRVGHTYPSYAYEVSREKVREYAAATGGDPSAYALGVPPEQAPEEAYAPPTFAACFTVGRLDVFLDDPELGAHPNLVHNQQQFTIHRPMRLGQVLVCTPRITDITPRNRMELMTIQVDCVDARTDQPVVTGNSTLIFFSQGA